MSKTYEIYEDGSVNPIRRMFNVMHDPLLMHKEVAEKQPGLPRVGSRYDEYPQFECTSVVAYASDDMTHYIVTATYKDVGNERMACNPPTDS